MSTRCRIGIEHEDDTIESIYCHHDGYYSYVGKLLYMHYTDCEKIDKLMQLGDMSCLGTEPVDAGWNKHIPYNSISHFYMACECFDEDDTEARISHSRQEFGELTTKCDGEYAYLFSKEGKWLVSCIYNNEDFVELTKELCEKKN